jgi:hypothetical protein
MQKPYPKYYTMKTLLGGDPDVNRRVVYDDQHRQVCVFNQDMRPWTEQNQRELDICVQALINASQTADTRPQPQSEMPGFGRSE